MQNLLYQKLLVFRNGLAREGQIAPFLVCSNGLLADLARARCVCVCACMSMCVCVCDLLSDVFMCSSKSPIFHISILSYLISPFFHISVLPYISRPLTLDSLKSVEGVSDIWLDKYGVKFLEAIDSFCQISDVDVPMDVHMTTLAQPQPTQTIVKVCSSETCFPLTCCRVWCVILG